MSSCLNVLHFCPSLSDVIRTKNETKKKLFMLWFLSAGHFLMHCDAFHHQNNDPPPALPVRSLRKVRPLQKYLRNNFLFFFRYFEYLSLSQFCAWTRTKHVLWVTRLMCYWLMFLLCPCSVGWAEYCRLIQSIVASQTVALYFSLFLFSSLLLFLFI